MAVGEHRVFIKNLPFTISEPEIRRNILALGLNDAVAVRINRSSWKILRGGCQLLWVRDDVHGGGCSWAYRVLEWEPGVRQMAAC